MSESSSLPVSSTAALSSVVQRAITVSLADRDGRPLTGGKVSALFVRPVEKTGLVEASLVEEVAGRHAGAVVLPSRGQWDVRVTVGRGGERVDARQRIFAKGARWGQR